MPRHGDLASRSEPRGIAKHRAESMDQANERGGAARRTGCCAYESRWLCLAAGCAMQVCAGAVYSFGSVAEDLKQNLELKDAHEQGLISIAGNLGLWIGSFTGGLLADARGPRTSMLGGAALFFVGYGAMYLALSHHVTFLRDPTVVAFFYLLAGLGSGWVMNSAMFTNTQNWEPARRAKVVSILATLMGAAATIWSTLFTGCLGGHAELSHDVTAAAGSTASLGGSAPPVLGGLAISSAPHAYSYAHEVEFVLPAGSEAGGGGGGNAHGAPRYGCAGGWVNGDVASFFGLLALALPTITLFGAWASFRMENEQQRRYADVQDGGDEAVARRLAHGIRTLLAILLVVGLCSVLAVVFDGDAAAVRVNEWGPLLMLSLLALLVALLGGQRDLVEKYWGIWSSDTGGAQGDLAVLLNKSSEAASTASAAQAKPVAAAAAHTPRTALVTIEFWLVFCVMATVCGSNSATMNVISTIIDDRHAGSRVVARITNVLLMTTSSLIRIVSGQLMAAAPNRPVHVWIVLMSSIASVIGQGLFTVDSNVCLFAAVIVVGASDGFFWGALPIVSNSIFGLKNSGGIYGMLNCFGAVGFISLSLGVQPAVYSSHSAEGMMECNSGVVCFRGFHVVCLCYSLFGCAAALGLVRAVARQQQRSMSSALLRASDAGGDPGLPPGGRGGRGGGSSSGAKTRVV